VSRAQDAQAFWQSPEHRGRQVDQYYRRFLRRHADPAGRAGWVNAFVAGATEVEVMQQFLASAEYRTARPGTAYVTGLYADVLGRSPSAAEVAGWQRALTGGLSPADVARSFLTSAEASRGYVDRVYSAFLDRAPDPAGAAFFTEQLSSGRLSLEGLAETVLASDEYFGRASNR